MRKKLIFLKYITFLGTVFGLCGCSISSNTKLEKELYVVDPLASDYCIGDIFDDCISNGGMQVQVKYNDGTYQTLDKTEYTYSLSKNGSNFNGLDPFTSTGSYTVSVKRNFLKEITYTISVSETEAELEGISISGQKTNFIIGETFTFGDGVVSAHYSNGATTNVTSKASFAGYNMSQKGTQVVTVTYENKTTSYSINVSDTPTPVVEEITPEEAVEIINGLQQNKVSDKEYYVRGVVTNVELDGNGFNGGFLSANLKFRSVKGNGLATTVDDVNGKEVVIFGYLENYNGIYQIPYLPASASPTGEKYNAKFTFVNSGSSEVVDVTNISISPSSKTLKVNETTQLSANILPINATDKSVSWTSKNKGICSVSSDGVVTANAIGSTEIIATSSNNISATCLVTVEKNQDTPVEGDKYEIKFNHFESDGQTELTTSSILDQVTAGSSYIKSFTSLTKIFKGMNGLKFGSSKSGGSLTFNLSDSVSNLLCSKIILKTYQYGTKSTTINVSVNGSLLSSGSSSSNQISIDISDKVKINNMTISSGARAYLSDITLVCEEEVPIPVTAISIPSTKSISTGNSETLVVTYTPSNANKGKLITWISNNTSVATVSNGVVFGKSAGNAVITAKSEGGYTSTCNVTVSNVAVTGISISSSETNINVGSTKQLSATISPSNATNKNVTWSSTNTWIATVDSTGLVTAVKAGSATIKATTVDGNKTASCLVTVTEQAIDKWTIMIYMCGADLESENGLASSDIMEILSVANQPDDVNILIETGGSYSWSLNKYYIQGANGISSSKLSRWHVKNQKIVLDEELPTYTSMGSSSTLESYLEWGINNYPAEKTGVIFWNHGGAMYGCCYDELRNDDSLINSEMKSAFSSAITSTGCGKLEFVGYDTCLTQVQDIADFNSSYFNYMIASEESELGYGWDYDTWVDNLYSYDTTENILKAIVDGFITDNGGARSYSDQTLSYLDLSKMGDYKTAFETFATKLKEKLASNNVSKQTFSNWMDRNVKAFSVDSEQNEAYFCLFDVMDMINKISSNSTYNPGSTYISNLINAFNNLVKYSVAQKGAGNAYGLGCIFVQSSVYSRYIKSAYVSSQTNFTQWLSFLKTYSYLG